MLLALALAAAAQSAPPPSIRGAGFLRQPSSPAVCRPDALEHARSRGPVGRSNLGELPDAHLMQAVYKRDARGCPIIDIVQPNVSARPDAEPGRRASSPQRGRERQR
jgi:hypothetical protein